MFKIILLKIKNGIYKNKKYYGTNKSIINKEMYGNRTNQKR